MKKIARYCVICLSIGLTSCNGLLDEVPKSELTTANFYKTSQDAVGAVNAVYDVLGNRYIYHFGITTLLMVPSTNIFTNREAWRQFDNFTFAAGEGDVIPPTYNYHYIGVMRSNAAIVNIPSAEMDETLKQRLIGEAKFLRALYYFNLVRLFGGVPLVLREANPSDNPARNSAEEVYKQILLDLQEAESVLPDSYSGSNRGRATKGAARALQARVYLTQKDWTNAAKKAKEVIDSNTYTLWDDYSQAFKEAANYGKENIFEVGFKSGLGDPTSGEGNILSYYTTPNNTSLPGVSGLCPTQRFFDSFESGDRRRDWGMYTSRVIGGVTYKFAPHIFKYTSEKYFTGEQPGWDASVNIPLIRYAGVLLMYAEAINEMSGPVDAAYEAINKVRLRAKIGSLATGLSKEAFRNAVYTEAEHELYLEGEDWFELVRTDRLISEHQKIGINVEAKYKLFPIPQREIDISNKVLVQNPGY